MKPREETDLLLWVVTQLAQKQLEKGGVHTLRRCPGFLWRGPRPTPGSYVASKGSKGVKGHLYLPLEKFGVQSRPTWPSAKRKTPLVTANPVQPAEPSPPKKP